jgi:pilus assembly protein CpaB
MSSRRTLILIAAIAVGALAAFAIFNYVQGIEDRANEDVQRVQVIKVTEPIPQGMSGREARELGYLDIDAAIANEFYPPTAVIDPAEIDTKIAVTDLAPNQVVVQNMFVERDNSLITNARRIVSGRVAITISVDNVRGVAGLIVPGDFVNMMAIPAGSLCEEGGDTTEEAAPTTTTPGDLTDLLVFCSPARMVYQGVQVLFVDRSPEPLPGEQVATDGTAPAPTNTGLLTLSVPPDAAQRIASVGADQWYLTLIPPDYTPTVLPPFDPTVPNLPGEDPLILTPYGPTGANTDDGTP